MSLNWLASLGGREVPMAQGLLALPRILSACLLLAPSCCEHCLLFAALSPLQRSLPLTALPSLAVFSLLVSSTERTVVLSTESTQRSAHCPLQPLARVGTGARPRTRRCHVALCGWFRAGQCSLRCKARGDEGQRVQPVLAWTQALLKSSQASGPVCLRCHALSPRPGPREHRVMTPREGPSARRRGACAERSVLKWMHGVPLPAVKCPWQADAVGVSGRYQLPVMASP